jgi:predicted alpha/beta superfamily hydrolase
MKILLSLSVIILLFSCKKETIQVDSLLVKTFSINSVEKGKTYKIWVKLPEGYDAGNNHYPTMYVLDAESNQEYVAKICGEVSKKLNSQNVIVVGIHYGDNRNVDYTPTSAGMGKGGGLQFLNFISKELIPRIQQDFRADTSRSKRIIIGHSFGGLFGAYAFVEHNEVFGNYLLLSPSLFYDNSIILQYEQQNRSKLKVQSQLVFIGLGSIETALLPANQLLNQRLTEYYSHTRSAYQLVQGKGHLSSKKQSIENAINFYFQHR